VKEVEVDISGISHTIQVDDDYVAPEVVVVAVETVPEPDKKAKAPANKAQLPAEK